MFSSKTSTTYTLFLGVFSAVLLVHAHYTTLTVLISRHENCVDD
jgi:hypothetical protein